VAAKTSNSDRPLEDVSSQVFAGWRRENVAHRSETKKNRAEILNQNQQVIGAPEEIRTPDPQIRSFGHALHPA
jgi:hypothetical protein